MKIYRSKVPTISDELAKQLIKEEAVEIDSEEMQEFLLDLESVFFSYIDTERRVHEEAQQILSSRKLDYSNFGRIKREIAKKYNFAIGDDAIDWITDQLIELLFHTTHVAEIWADNNDIRRIARPLIQKHTAVDEEIDAEVRKKIKNLSEGSLAWDVKYQQVLQDIKRQKGIH